MKIFRHQNSFYSLFFCYVGGLLCSELASTESASVSETMLLFWCLCLLGGMCCLWYGLKQGKFLVCLGLICCLIAWSMGGLRTATDTYIKNHSVGLSSQGESGYYWVEVQGEPKEKPKTYQWTVSVLARYTDSLKGWEKIEGKALLYFQKNELSKALSPGDFLQIYTSFKPLSGSYAQFMKNKHIKVSGYVSKKQWEVASSIKARYLKRFALSLRSRMERFLETPMLTHSERGVAKALLLGDKTEMDPEVQQEYRNTGVVHVLCVSGMHLGVVAYVMMALLSFLKTAKCRVIKGILVSLTLWIYALLTGLSPSVCRAACMFTFVSMGVSMGRSLPIGRSLALSAWLLLWIEPNWLWDVGFELSYLAVWGIAFLCPKQYPKWIEKRKVIKKIASLFLVSFAAQCATAPLSIYYFQQFPIYFWAANAIISPLSSFVLPLGLVGCFLQMIWEGWLVNATAYLLHMGLACMNGTAAWIETWPGSVQIWSLPLLSCLLAYGGIYTFRSFCKTRCKMKLHIALGCMLGVLVLV